MELALGSPLSGTVVVVRVQIALQTLESRFLFVGIKEHWPESIDCFRYEPLPRRDRVRRVG